MRFLGSLAAAAAMLVTAFAAAPAAAQDGPLTIDRLIERGTVNVGIILDSPPYGLLDANQQPDGFDVEVAKLLGKYLGVEVNIVSLVGANRIPFLLTNKIDLVIAGLGITPERAKQVAFSIPYSSIDNVVYAPKDREINSAEDMEGLRIAVVRGSAQDTIITRDLDGRAEIMRFDENPSVIQAMLTGQVDAAALTAILGDPAFARSPEANIERKYTLLQQSNGIAMRKENTELLQWVNTFVYYIKSNGELDKIYKKWWERPLPNLPTF